MRVRRGRISSGCAAGHRARTPRRDPLAGFDVTTDGATLSVTQGRYYVDGILAQKEATTADHGTA
jgi:hypothetical protein